VRCCAWRRAHGIGMRIKMTRCAGALFATTLVRSRDARRILRPLHQTIVKYLLYARRNVARARQTALACGINARHLRASWATAASCAARGRRVWRNAYLQRITSSKWRAKSGKRRIERAAAEKALLTRHNRLGPAKWHQRRTGKMKKAKKKKKKLGIVTISAGKKQSKNQRNAPRYHHARKRKTSSIIEKRKNRNGKKKKKK